MARTSKTNSTNKSTRGKARPGTARTNEKPSAKAAAPKSPGRTARSAAATSVAPDREQVARRAYEIWERRGRAEGLDYENWSLAEQELLAPAG